jgi:hypothetical protein
LPRTTPLHGRAFCHSTSSLRKAAYGEVSGSQEDPLTTPRTASVMCHTRDPESAARLHRAPARPETARQHVRSPRVTSSTSRHGSPREASSGAGRPDRAQCPSRDDPPTSLPLSATAHRSIEEAL